MLAKVVSAEASAVTRVRGLRIGRQMLKMSAIPGQLAPVMDVVVWRRKSTIVG